MLCKRVIDREKLLVMEAEIVETLCLFERFFPPSFFDIMVHLTVHVGREARLGGPVQFRWMYPFERYYIYDFKILTILTFANKSILTFVSGT